MAKIIKRNIRHAQGIIHAVTPNQGNPDALKNAHQVRGRLVGDATEAPIFNATPAGFPAWPTTVEAFEQASLSFSASAYFQDGGTPASYALSGDVPTWMTITNQGVVRGTPPDGDRDYGAITVTATNAIGSASSTSFTLTTPANVSVTFNPISQYGKVGGAVAFTAQADAVTGYQWYRNGSPIPGATGFVLNVTPVAQANNNDEYFCRCTGYGGVTKDTAVARLSAMHTYNNIADGSGTTDETVGVGLGQNTLSMSGSGQTKLYEAGASVNGID